MSHARWLLAIDDTDALGRKPGTGRLARMLADEIGAERGLERLGVVRQQLLVHPAVPYTSHNSPACIVLSGELGGDAADALFARGCAWLTERHAPGSDPGLCLVREPDVSDEVVAFGQRAATVVLKKSEALDLARGQGIRLAELGGTGDGVIGALAAAGLTAAGTAGRFIEFGDGLRDLPDPVAASELRARGIVVVSAARDAELVPDDARISSGDWVRPRLVGGRAVLFVEPSDGGWCTAETKRIRGLGSVRVVKEKKDGEESA